MSDSNLKPFVVSVRGDGDLVHYKVPLSDEDFDLIQDSCEGDILMTTRDCIALCRKRGIKIQVDTPLIDIPAYMAFEELRVASESEL